MDSLPEVIVVTNCTNRKRKADIVLGLQDLGTASSLDELAGDWKRRVQTVAKRQMQPAVVLYAGRSITEARRTAEILAAPLYIVSAGHGLVRSEEPIPSYNVTATPGPDNELHRCLVRLGKTPSDWWQALVDAFGRRRSLAELVKNSGIATVLLAVPSAYLALLERDLTELDKDDLSRLRILTSPHGAAGLRERLQLAVLPYDERLEGMAAFAGTRSDFPQRALHHFVAVLKGHELPLDVARERVRLAMNALRKPALPKRQRRSDEEIMALLRQNWARFNGSATGLLRFLRDEALVACEQSRFRLLRLQILSECNKG
jgi:hypothetical protein